jgi:mediator of RNA polymerase II transcription subunit 31
MSNQGRFEGVSESDRLLCDLEFVQGLCNVRYLQYLAVNKYLSEPSFMSYLKYLRYWKEPKYTRLLQFPQCLKFLDQVIDNEDFRRELLQPSFIDFIHQQQGAHWMIGPK